ncbi:MAG: DUF2332 family protein [Actinomycetota bacterium]|nr:DUF2332 family protein [Actinomycetota bacterium]
MTSKTSLRSAADLQGRLCSEHGSPTWAAVIAAIDDQLDDSTSATSRLLLNDPRDPVESAVFLRILGAVHRLLLLGISSDLSRYLPSLGGQTSPHLAAKAFLTFVGEHENRVQAEMQHPVQTNEVARSGILSAGLRTIVAETHLPVRLLEVGSSAGLNLRLDEYRIHMGEEFWGPEDSPVVLDHLLNSGQPDGAAFVIVDRAGCDLSPINAASDAGQVRLRSFIWPEDRVRMSRLNAALSVFEPVRIDAASATDWVRSQCATPQTGHVTVVMHSIVMPYLTGAERQEFVTVMDDLGAQAATDAPLAWLRMEFDDNYGTVSLELDLWPLNRHEVLATCNPHGANINWLPVASRT